MSRITVSITRMADGGSAQWKVRIPAPFLCGKRFQAFTVARLRAAWHVPTRSLACRSAPLQQRATLERTVGGAPRLGWMSWRTTHRRWHRGYHSVHHTSTRTQPSPCVVRNDQRDEPCAIRHLVRRSGPDTEGTPTLYRAQPNAPDRTRHHADGGSATRSRYASAVRDPDRCFSKMRRRDAVADARRRRDTHRLAIGFSRICIGVETKP